MTLEEIKANAPEGATHYKLYGDLVVYYAISGGLKMRFRKTINDFVQIGISSMKEIKPL